MVDLVDVEIHDTQTAKEAFGSDAVAYGVGDADATQCCGHNGCESFKVAQTKLFERPNFAAIEQSRQDQGVYTWPLAFNTWPLAFKVHPPHA